MLCLLLAVLMLATIAMPLGAFAEGDEYNVQSEEYEEDYTDDTVEGYTDDTVEDYTDDTVEDYTDDTADGFAEEDYSNDASNGYVKEADNTEDEVDEGEVEAAEVLEGDLFKEGLAIVKAEAEIFVDEKCEELAGTVIEDSVIYVTEAEDEILSEESIVKFDANVNGKVKAFYVRYADVVYMTEEQANYYFASNSIEDRIDYFGIQMAPLSIEKNESTIETADSEIQIIKESNDQIELFEATYNESFITVNPEDHSGAVGTNATFTVEADSEDVTYQWQARKNSTSTWSSTKMSGYATKTLTVPIIDTRNGYQYRCLVTKNGVTQESTVATLTVVNDITVNNIVYRILIDTNTSRTVEVASYIGSSTAPVVPATISYNNRTYQVVAIGEEAFANTSITMITLPNSIVEIKARAFKNCSSLSQMDCQ